MENIKVLLSTKDLSIFANILSNSISNISFWGNRIVKSPLYEGKVPLEKVTKHVLKLFNPLMKNWDYSLQDRANIKIIESFIDKAYQESKILYKKLSLISKIFFHIQKLFNIFFSYKKRWENSLSLTNLYSAAQYRRDLLKDTLPKESEDVYKGIELYYPEIEYTPLFEPKKINFPMINNLIDRFVTYFSKKN